MTRKRVGLITLIAIVVAITVATFINFSNLFQGSKNIIILVIFLGTAIPLGIFWAITDYQPKFIDWIEKKLKIKAP